MRTVLRALPFSILTTVIGCGGPLCDPGWRHIPGTYQCMPSDASVDGAPPGELGDSSTGTTGAESAGNTSMTTTSGATDHTDAGVIANEMTSGAGGSTALDSGVEESGRTGTASPTGGTSGSGTSGTGIAAGSGGGVAAPAVPRCGDGHVDQGETCDGSCPTKDSCESTNACLVASFSGDPSNCAAKCDLTMVMECRSGDGCCAPGCNYGTDTDCSKSCGDGVVTAPETCEPTSKTQPCPSACDDSNSCTKDTLTGTAAQCNIVCNHMAITAAVSGDGCCPSGANATTDSDCQPRCGNGVTEAGETCDGNCPTSCGANNGCVTSVLAGSASNCNAVCTPSTITTAKSGDGCCPSGANSTTDSDCSPTCGNGVVESGEACDGNCPTSCGANNGCVTSVLTGNASNCNAVCTPSTITTAKSGDGCCPTGANFMSDTDCQPRCGDGIVSNGELCDPGPSSTKPCSANCDDGNPCTADGTVGKAETCDLGCSHVDALAGTACGTNAVCGETGDCLTGCTLGQPKCAGQTGTGSCVIGSTEMVCAQGMVCVATYLSPGSVCAPNHTCDENHNCVSP